MSNEAESAKLISDLEQIYLQSGWRNNPALVDRAREIKARLGELLSPARCLTDGSPVTPDHRELDPTTGQQKAYIVLTPEERAKGWVRPYRDTYIHKTCGVATKMGRAIAETYARDPKFYSGTFCVQCKTHFPLDQFVWDGTNIQVGE